MTEFLILYGSQYHITSKAVLWVKEEGRGRVGRGEKGALLSANQSPVLLILDCTAQA